MAGIEIIPVEGIGEVGQGDNLGALIAESAEQICAGDVVVVTQKIVSKAEGRIVPCESDQERLELAISESKRVLRRRGDLVITETRHGFICANSGVDASNVPAGTAALLPVDPDRSAHRIREELRRIAGVDVGVVVTDTFGRPWRLGVVDVAIGVSGILPILDLRGTKDSSGRILEVTEVAVADEIAAAADLVMGKSSGCPVAIVRGYAGPRGDGRAEHIIRPPGEDLFR